MSDDDVREPPSSADVAGEDFLFHLYRGSELLQDNRVHDAKAELEQALSLQPEDPKGQDLLAIVYFRLGMYPRAIAIYERLIRDHPQAITPRVNLALSYLKTGQPQEARAALERVIEINPEHSRAWGYLGLAFQRMGDYERAGHAFAAGGHDHMAKRLLELAGATTSNSLRPEGMAPERAAVGKAAGEAFLELERQDGGFRADVERRSPSGTWAAMEPGRVAPARPSEPPPRAPSPLAPSLAASATTTQLSVAAPPSAPLTRPSPPAPAMSLGRDLLLVFSRDNAVALHPSGVVLARAAASFAARFDCVRSMAYPTGWSTSLLRRRMRGKDSEEPLGGPAAPVLEITGRGELVLGPLAGQHLQPIAVGDDALYLRETSVIAFESSVAYENGRLPLGDGEAIGMLQLRGSGAAVASFPSRMVSVEVSDARPTALRAHSILGWVGKLIPRALPPSEAPAGIRGFIAMTGEGIVFVDVR